MWGGRIAPLFALFGVSAAVLASLASRVGDWVVMTDELQYAKLATNIGETLSPLPTLRGAHYATSAQLYPTLIAPFYGNMSALDAFRAAHVENGILFASVVFPVFVLARQARLSGGWSVACDSARTVVPRPDPTPHASRSPSRCPPASPLPLPAACRPSSAPRSGWRASLRPRASCPRRSAPTR